MKNNIGLWMDHKRAVIVPAQDAGTEIKVILSQTDRQPGRMDGERSTAPFEAFLVEADDVTQRKFTAHLHAYYEEIAASLLGARAVLILGPGEAKGELRKHLASVMPKDCLVTVETADKMTDRQIAAKVHDHFKAADPVIVLR